MQKEGGIQESVSEPTRFIGVYPPKLLHYYMGVNAGILRKKYLFLHELP
uniref:Macaca fascicularis brain cDNA, clone: QflA-16465 n=1 Tax=Macaca fascicularis TaxID=9541 RepID=I7GI19_MACFA|nr:unnamed protein product [Macaca fascicularis]